MMFAERYHWQNIDDMTLFERRRKLELIEALSQAQAPD